MAVAWALAASGVLILGLGLFHSILGEKYLVRRLLRRSDLPRLFGDDSFTRLTIRYAWHLLSIFCAAAAVLLFMAAARPPEGLSATVIVLAGTFAACGLWGLVATRGRHLSWIVLLLAAALAAWGAAG